MFLQLLVSQLQNQDPLNPTDSTQFVSQLAQISELEQVIGIRGDIETEMAAGGTAVPTTTDSTPTTTPASSDLAASATNNNGITPANNAISS
jgi:flagellar basal-body rod modification protein FlgD